MAKISPLDPLGLTLNPAKGPETLGIAYDYDTKLLHRLENAQIYSFFEKKANCYTKRFWGQKMNFHLLTVKNYL